MDVAGFFEGFDGGYVVQDMPEVRVLWTGGYGVMGLWGCEMLEWDGWGSGRDGKGR